MTESSVIFEAEDGLTLEGVFHTPRRPPTASVVLAHGILVHKDYRDFYPRLADALGARRMDSLRFDFRGHGGSEGQLDDVTIAGETQDLQAAMGLFQGPSAPPVAVVGTSLGAAVAVLEAAHSEVPPSALVLLSAILDLRRWFLEPETPWAKKWFSPTALNEAQSTGVLPVGDAGLGLELLREFQTFRPEEVLRELELPVLMIHSERDPVAPYAAARDAAEASPGVVFVGMEEGEHYFEGVEDRVFREVVGWLEAQLPSGSEGERARRDLNPGQRLRRPPG